MGVTEMSTILNGYWNGSGLKPGDTVLVHSSFIRVLKFLLKQGVRPSPGFIIESLLNEVGPEGTLIFPLFNFDFPNSQFFSMLTTPSQMGVVTEFARKNYEGFRTGHPIYSFYAIGRNAAEFCGIDNNSGYGVDSPFAKLVELDGKIASIDLEDQSSMTMYHHVEEIMNVNYRYFKTFTGTYENESGCSSEKNYSLFVRDLDKGVVTNVNPMGEILWNEGHYQGFRPGVKNGMRTIQASTLVKRTSQEIIEGRAISSLYSIINDDLST
jgi:aminoglycoside 3-N-acetyltransferase